MRTGVILYIAAGHRLDDEVEAADLVKGLGIEADRVEVVSSKVGYDSIVEAWWRLAIKGMHRIVCKAAEAVDSRKLKLMDREVTLCSP